MIITFLLSMSTDLFHSLPLSLQCITNYKNILATVVSETYLTLLISAKSTTVANKYQNYTTSAKGDWGICKCARNSKSIILKLLIYIEKIFWHFTFQIIWITSKFNMKWMDMKQLWCISFGTQRCFLSIRRKAVVVTSRTTCCQNCFGQTAKENILIKPSLSSHQTQHQMNGHAKRVCDICS